MQACGKKKKAKFSLNLHIKSVHEPILWLFHGKTEMKNGPAVTKEKDSTNEAVKNETHASLWKKEGGKI